MNDLPLVDAHLDLAENVTLFGRDLTSSVATIRALEKRAAQQATVSLPDLARGGIAVICATVTAGFLAADVGADFEPRSAIYHTPEEAQAQALTQIGLSIQPVSRSALEQKYAHHDHAARTPAAACRLYGAGRRLEPCRHRV